jgi:integrase
MSEKKRPPGLYRRGRVWWVKYYVNGRPVRESTGTGDQRKAEKFLKDRTARVTAGLPVLPRTERIRYIEAADDLRVYYRTTGARQVCEAETCLRHLDGFFRGHRLVDITGAEVQRYIEFRQGMNRSNGTVNRELSTLSRMLRLAYENAKLLRLPVIRKLKEGPPRSGFFERDQFLAVRRRLPESCQVAVTLAYTYGWRMQSEVLALERRHLDLEAGTLRLDAGTTKNDDGRVVYLTPELRAMLTAQVERVRGLERRLGRIVPWLFPHLGKGPYAGRRLRDFRKRWVTACTKAGVPGRLRHDFRRTAVRNLVNAGVAERVAMTITGHKTRSVFDRYHIVSPGDLQEATRRLMGTSTGTIDRVSPNPAR